ncbi:hypothetical protein XENOCAPTIV_003787 [Xenoophorus captivus]|uniref:Uncharacterized protein n=1 Tax=Xenoophorus captivus TaxID=1517983 RepID=A0ABV0R6P5_9TELE
MAVLCGLLLTILEEEIDLMEVSFFISHLKHMGFLILKKENYAHVAMASLCTAQYVVEFNLKPKSLSLLVEVMGLSSRQMTVLLCFSMSLKLIYCFPGPSRGLFNRKLIS